MASRTQERWQVSAVQASFSFLFPFSFAIPRGFPQKAGNAIRKVPHGLYAISISSPITSWRNREPMHAYKLAVINYDACASGHFTNGRSRRPALPSILEELRTTRVHRQRAVSVRSPNFNLQTPNFNTCSRIQTSFVPSYKLCKYAWRERMNGKTFSQDAPPVSCCMLSMCWICHRPGATQCAVDV
jgi:hypothetical protein